ncbi:cytochrome P450-14 [Coleophoma cylindrospora]|uniref:Cytochrome P450-14 n=1 Tax=Coleophoma cylindrospora TaxID=1849047 RepID=A0A3D8Q8S3_9HELO|nr:cytochrome P450-14 [Coleophoma cylindrospora]
MALVALVAGAALIYYMGVLVYRLYFSPIAKFPGPRLAAATLWYEFYYDVVQTGQYTFKIQQLHKEYGPIVRISPFELHIDDPEYYEVLYSRSSPRDKYEFFTQQFGNPLSGFGTVPHALHRLRRQPLNEFFSKASISKLEPVLTTMTEKLCSRIDQYKGTGEPLSMRHVYMCLTTDVITLYSMNRSWNHLDSYDFSPMWCKTIKATAEAGPMLKQFPWLFPIINSMPDWMLGALNPGMLLLLTFQRDIARQIQNIMDNPEEEGELPRTIFHALLKSNLPVEEKSLKRLWQEGQIVVGAGADTTASVLSVTTFHILDNPDKLQKLKDELENAFPDRYAPVTLAVAEQLPYLTNIILEGLRLSYGISSRLQRVAPNETLQFHEWTIPPGTPVGMTSVMMHHNEDIFPDSYSFIPERWVDKSLQKYLVPFTKGSRQCIGINLARAELCLVLATVFRRYDMELFDTVRNRDVDLAHEMFLPQPSQQSKGVRVMFS